jgi:hypothetical protein
MIEFNPLTPEQRQRSDGCKTALSFETPKQIDILRIAAQARIAACQERQDAVFPLDEYINNFPKGYLLMPLHRGLGDELCELVEDYERQNYVFAANAPESEIAERRKRSGEFAVDIKIALTIFDIESFLWDAAGAGHHRGIAEELPGLDGGLSRGAES